MLGLHDEINPSLKTCAWAPGLPEKVLPSLAIKQNKALPNNLAIFAHELMSPPFEAIALSMDIPPGNIL